MLERSVHGVEVILVLVVIDTSSVMLERCNPAKLAAFRVAP
jgi:hypothetical protein